MGAAAQQAAPHHAPEGDWRLAGYGAGIRAGRQRRRLEQEEVKEQEQEEVQGVCRRPGPPPPSSPPPPPPPPPPLGESDPFCWDDPDLTFGGSRRWAQAFVSNTTSSIAGFECLVETSSEGDEFALELRALAASGAPSSNVIASATVMVEEDGQTQLLGSFDEAVSLVAGTGHAFSITLIDGDVLTPRGRNGNICPQQLLYFDASAHGAFILHDTAFDMIFASLSIM